MSQWYWARIAGVRIKGRICGWYGHEAKFLALTPEKRARAIQSLKPYGIKALVGKGRKFSELEHEGWRPIPGVKDYYIYLFSKSKQSEWQTRPKGANESLPHILG
jgi:hypothetical protein